MKLSGTNYKDLGDFSSGQSTRPIFNKLAFVSNSNDKNLPLGNAYRNYGEVRQPGTYDEDVKVSKAFAVGERVKVSLEMNYFNVLNRVRFNGPVTNVDDSHYGYVTPGQNNNPRQGQLGARVSF